MKIGERTFIGKNCYIKRDNLIIGDYTTIGDNCRIDVPELIIGDYGKIYSDCLLYGKKPMHIGHNFFLGGHSILNSYDNLTIENGVGLGTYSQVWTHAYWGEEMEGCLLNVIKPTILHEGVWCAGHVIVGAGIEVGKYSIIMPGAMLTKSTEPYSVWGGVPAVNITHKIKGYKEISLDDKYEYLYKHCEEFAKLKKYEINGYRDMYSTGKLKMIVIRNSNNNDQIHIYKDSVHHFNEKFASFVVEEKIYTKRKAPLEVEFMKYMSDYKARFYPIMSDDGESRAQL